jgi:hypothetical protein
MSFRIFIFLISFLSGTAWADRVVDGAPSPQPQRQESADILVSTSYFGQGEEIRGQVREFFDLAHKFTGNPELKGSQQAVQRALAFYVKNKTGIPKECGGEMSGKPIANDEWVAVVDYTKPMDEKRMFFLNIKTGEVIATAAAHGYGSNKNCPEDETFRCKKKKTWVTKCKIPATVGNGEGNKSGLTSRGFYLTDGGYASGQDTFQAGSPAYQVGDMNALYLRGLIDDVNDHAYGRNVVFHRGSYVHDDYVNECSNSAGCPSTSPDVFEKMKDKLKNGALFYLHTLEDEKKDRPDC